MHWLHLEGKTPVPPVPPVPKKSHGICCAEPIFGEMTTLGGSLIESGDEIVANGRLLDLIRRVRTFGISTLWHEGSTDGGLLRSFLFDVYITLSTSQLIVGKLLSLSLSLSVSGTNRCMSLQLGAPIEAWLAWMCVRNRIVTLRPGKNQ